MDPRKEINFDKEKSLFFLKKKKIYIEIKNVRGKKSRQIYIINHIT